MQSWGTSSRFEERDTQMEPSKSGVIGLLCAALGRSRDADLLDLASLRFGVRVDRQGVLQADYQVAQNVLQCDGKTTRPITSRRYFLSDAAFLAGLEASGKDGEKLLVKLDAALRRPHWQMYLGRKAFVPSAPPAFPFRPDGLPGPDDAWNVVRLPLEEVLERFPPVSPLARGRGKRRGTGGQDDETTPVRVVIEVATEVRMIVDQPENFLEQRYLPRYVKETYVNLDPDGVMNWTKLPGEEVTGGGQNGG